MVLPDQLLARVLGDLAELVVDVADDPGNVGGGDDRRLVEGIAEVLELADVEGGLVSWAGL